MIRNLLFILFPLVSFVGNSAVDYAVSAPYTSPTRSTCGAGNNCSLRTSEEHEYQVTIPTSGNWTFSLCGSSYDTYIYIGTTLCSSNVGLNDDFCGLQSQVTANITAGTYYVTVEGFSGCGSYVLNITGPPPPAGPEDLCGGAIPLSCGSIVSGNTGTYGADVVPFCGTGDGTGGGVWYSIVGNGGNITASLCGSSYDSKIRVFSGTCASLVCTAGNDDFCGLQSEVSWLSTLGTTYYILVHGFGSASGAYTLTTTCAAPPPPPAPNCYALNAIPYAPEAFAGTALSLTDDVHSGVVNIGFNFCYFGTNYTQCVISSNNYLTFDLSTANAWSPWTTVAVPNTTPTETRNAVLGPWQDINPGVGGNVYYQTLGTAPNRIFVVSYENVPMFSCTGLLYTSQIILREGSNCIETHIVNKPICTTWNSGNAVHGIQEASGTVANVFAGRNNTAWTASAEGTLWTPNCGVCMTATSPTCLPVALPVELLSFSGRKDGRANVLDWTTASEMNNDYFTVERSIDGQNFHDVAYVDGAGNSNVENSYFARDEHPFSGINYYRLKQTDFDGQMKYSDVVAINNDPVSEFQVFPNPTDGILTVALPETPDESVKAVVRNAVGQLVLLVDVKSRTSVIDVSQLTAGVYFIEVIIDGEAKIQKFSVK